MNHCAKIACIRVPKDITVHRNILQMVLKHTQKIQKIYGCNCDIYIYIYLTRQSKLYVCKYVCMYVSTSKLMIQEYSTIWSCGSMGHKWSRLVLLCSRRIYTREGYRWSSRIRIRRISNVETLMPPSRDAHGTLLNGAVLDVDALRNTLVKISHT